MRQEGCLEELLSRWLAGVGAPKAVETLAELMPNAAVFMVDRERSVVFWSHGAEALLGFSHEALLGRHCLKGIRCDRCLSGCGLSEHREIRGAKLTLFRSDGKPVFVKKYATAFFGEGDQFLGGIEVLIPDSAGEIKLPEGLSFHGIYSVDPAMHELFATIKNVAETDATVLIRGESGSGKELVARAIHQESKRRQGPFVAINCAALTPTLLESELFGHKKGAFTGADSDRSGVFQQAHQGTLFLDEVAEIPLPLQAKLLRVLQEKTFVPVGGSKPISVDVRVISATHRALREEVKAGRFREDLMFRLRVVPLFLPSLRERPKDIEFLLKLFIARQNEKGPRKIEEIEPEALSALEAYHWPGNVRELQNVVSYLFAVGRGATLRRAELPQEVTTPAPLGPPQETKEAPPQEERAQIEWALQKAHGNVGEAAALLGMSRPTFWRKRKKFNL